MMPVPILPDGYASRGFLLSAVCFTHLCLLVASENPRTRVWASTCGSVQHPAGVRGLCVEERRNVSGCL